MRELATKGILVICALTTIFVGGCSSNNYSETTPDKAQAARERIKEAEQTPPGMTK